MTVNRINLVSRVIVLLTIVLVPAYVIFIRWEWQSLAAIQRQSGLTPVVLITTVSMFVAFIGGFWLIRGFGKFSSRKNRQQSEILVQSHIPEAIDQLARKFDYSVVTGGEDTENELLERIMQEMRQIALSSPYDPKPLRQSPSAGRRLAALIMLQVQPDFDSVDWLAKRMTQEKKFLGVQTALAILSAAKLSDRSQRFGISKSIDHLVASSSPVFDATDARRRILEQATKELWN
jgi:hypothetical protein